MRIAAILGVAAMAFAGAALAADEEVTDSPSSLQPGVEVQSSLHHALEVGGNFYRCFSLETARGSKWQLHVSQKKHDNQYLQPAVFIGAGCSGKQVEISERKNEYESRLVGGDFYGAFATFASGGGTYSAMVFAAKAADFGMFRITATEVAAAGSISTGLAANTADVAYAQAFGKETASTATASAPDKYKVGDVIKDCPDCPSLVVVPPGAFIMGSTAAEEDRNGNEGPAHRVTIARAFAIGQLEISFAEWDACVADGACAKPADNGWGRGKRPAINVSWNDARTYVGWISRKTGQRYYLPSESEWEYAARAGTKTPWNTGSGIVSDDANIMDAFKQTVPGGGFPANGFGLYDVHGNVWEWVIDCYEIGYFGVPADGGASIATDCPNHVMRGGSYANAPKDVRSAARSGSPPDTKGAYIGFRVARAL